MDEAIAKATVRPPTGRTVRSRHASGSLRLLTNTTWLAPLIILNACGTATYGSTDSSQNVTCDDLLERAITLELSGQTGNGHDALSDTLETMRIGCPTQHDVFADYSSGKAMAEEFGWDPCTELALEFEPLAIQLLDELGFCTGGSTGDPPDASEETQPGGGIAWNDASAHVGAVQRVCGPLAGIGGSDDDVFLNIGRDYPDPNRFTIVVWDIGGVEPVEAGTTVCVSGLITQYEGVAQIQLRSTSQVELYW